MMNKTYQTQNVLWHCESCELWWWSEPKSAYRWRLSRLIEIDSLAQQITRAPSWNVCGPSPGVCLECGGILVEEPIPP